MHVATLEPETLRTLLPLLLGGLAIALAFIKVSIVLAILRRGLGGGVPPASVLAVLAILLATLAMMPTLERSQRAIAELPSTASAEQILQAGSAPLSDFLRRHTEPREQQAVRELAARLASADATAEAGASGAVAPPMPQTPTAEPLTTLAPAFALSELRLAFVLGFGLLLPLLLIDLLCAVVLSGLDLHGLSPGAVALPFKLLLFVVANGWQLVLRGLLLGYA